MIEQTAFILEAADFQKLLDVLRGLGYQLIGPTRRDGAVLYDELESAAELPLGWTDEQERGHYRLMANSHEAYFGYTLGPQSWKRFLHPPQMTLWQAQRSNGTFSIQTPDEEPPAYALIGVRACELHAIAIQDRVFLQGPYIDPIYQKRREKVFIVAVNCGHAGGTCFCASLGTGPQVEAGYDLALTEILEDDAHYFLLEYGSERGLDVLKQLPHRTAAAEEIRQGQAIIAATAAQMGRSLDTSQLKQALYERSEDPHWEEIAQRCLSCGNCTMVCPTCFCTTIEDVSDLSGETAERQRVWDSCFTMDFSYIHGGSVRYSAKARYRQWLTHKMASWIDQFGLMGCVGCGRCITWCPVGIDITAEASVIQASYQETEAAE